MSNNYSSMQSETDWERIDAMRDEDIDFSEQREATAEDFQRGQFYVGNVPVPPHDVKVDMELELDAWLVEYFRQQAGERDPAALINQMLKQAVVDNTARQIAERFREEEQRPVPA